MYSLCGQVLQCVDKAKYLGVTISNELKWSPHVTVWYRTKFGSQNLATEFGNHMCMATNMTKIGSQC